LKYCGILGILILFSFLIVVATVAALGVPYGLILYGEFTTTLVDRTIGIGTSTDTIVLNWYGGGRIL
jgi:ATP-binding cassette subfamily B (MDR/TAP) protein 1